MAKPTINRIKPFDADCDTAITFSWIGFQPYSNRIVIYENTTMSIVFDHTIESMLLKQNIPAYTLQNGKTYIIQCQVFDENGNSSELSNKHYFNTYTTPQFLFDNINDGETVTTASCSASVLYYQPEAEPLYFYRFALYDSYKTLIFETDDIYNTDNISYVYKGLNTETIYYIRCYGVTLNGIDVDTGYVEINVNYGIKTSYARIYVENDSGESKINYRTNLNIIFPENDDYEYDEGKINLIGKTIVYKEGFKIDTDFTLKISGNYLYRQGDVLILKNEDTDVRITSYIYDDKTIRYKLIVPNGISNYILYSNPIQCSNDALITILLRRIKNIYAIDAFV